MCVCVCVCVCVCACVYVCMCVYIYIYIYTHTHINIEARGGTVGGDTALQAGRSRVRFPMVSLELSIHTILPLAL